VNQTDTSQRLVEILAAPVQALGLDLERVDVTPAGKRRIVRVAVDRDGGVTLDDIAEATRAVSSALDDADPLGDRPYTLEVSSPGVDRPLTLPRHWRRNAGRLVKVTLLDGTQMTGRVVGSDEEVAHVDVSGIERPVRLDQVKRAKVQIEFNPHELG